MLTSTRTLKAMFLEEDVTIKQKAELIALPLVYGSYSYYLFVWFRAWVHAARTNQHFDPISIYFCLTKEMLE